MGVKRSYWREREEAQRLLDMRSDAAMEKEYEMLYKRAFDDIQREIDAFYSRYAAEEGISIAEARKRVSGLDTEAYSRKAKAYVEERNFTKQANDEMRLYNLTMKLNRLEMLKSKIALELAAKSSAEERHLKSVLEVAARKELERQSGILGESVPYLANPKQIRRIVEGDFHNAKFSERIWSNNKLLQMAIEKELQTGLIQGRRPDYKRVAQLFNASEYAAKRLLHTETKRVRTEAAKERYQDNGIDEYEYMALGPNPCPICSELDGKHFPVKKMVAGENAPPMHPNCRCSTAPYVDEASYNDWLDAKEKGSFSGAFKEWSKNALKISSPGSTKSLKRSLASIRAGHAGLDKRRTNILKKLPVEGEHYRFDRGTISTRDLAYLSAAAGVEFSLFRSKHQDILVRGNSRTCNVYGDLADEIREHGYEWVAHSHVDGGPLMSSAEDRSTLRKLGQHSSVIVGINGDEIEFFENLFG